MEFVCEWQKTGDFSSLCGVARCSIVSLWNWFWGKVMGNEGFEDVGWNNWRGWKDDGDKSYWKTMKKWGKVIEMEIECQTGDWGKKTQWWSYKSQLKLVLWDKLVLFCSRMRKEIGVCEKVICESVFLCFVVPINCQACPCSLSPLISTSHQPCCLFDWEQDWRHPCLWLCGWWR